MPDTATTAAIDPVTVEVIGNAIASIADEMGETLVRASYSTNIKERRDCSTVIFDAAGRTLYQAEHIPIHLGSLMGVVEAILDLVRAFRPEDDSADRTDRHADIVDEFGALLRRHDNYVDLAPIGFCQSRSGFGRLRSGAARVALDIGRTLTVLRKRCGCQD